MESLGGEDVPLVILSDPAYPLIPWVMKAFADNSRLSPAEGRLSRARVTVEHAYGRQMAMLVEETTSMLVTCPNCLLYSAQYNICEIHGDTFDEE